MFHLPVSLVMFLEWPRVYPAHLSFPALLCSLGFSSGLPDRSGHLATRDVRGTREAQALRVPCSSDLAGSKTSGARHLSGVRPGVTMLVISRDPEHQDCSFVYSCSVDRSRSACYGRPASHRLGTCQLCARSKRRSGSPSASRREAESLRCETVQVE